MDPKTTSGKIKHSAAGLNHHLYFPTEVKQLNYVLSVTVNYCLRLNLVGRCVILYFDQSTF